MRINDIINEASASLRVPPGDPILNDSNLYKLLEHYLGKTFIGWAIENSPYTMSGRNSFEQIAARLAQPTYNNVAAAIIPLAAQENPDIERIMRIVFRIPSFVSQADKIRILDTIDRTRAADAKNGWTFREKSPAAPAAPVQTAVPAAAPDTAQISSL
jgi:hypothetical protein